MHFTLKQWISDSGFHFHSTLLTSDKTVALLRSRSAPRPFISGRPAFSAKCSHGDDGRLYQERVKGLQQRGFFLQIDAKSSTKTCLEAEE